MEALFLKLCIILLFLVGLLFLWYYRIELLLPLYNMIKEIAITIVIEPLRPMIAMINNTI